MGVSAVVHAENQASAPGAGAEEFPRPELVTEMAAPAAALDDHPLLPRRKRVAQPDAPGEDAAHPRGTDASMPGPGAVDDGPGQSMFTARPDSSVLAQVLQGLRRMG